MRSKIVVASVAACVSTVLHGCGGGGPTTAPTAAPTPAPGPAPAPTTPTPKPTPASTPPPTPAPTPTPARTPPLTEAEAVKYLNDNYLAFDESDEKSALGVSIYMASLPETFYGNIYCSQFENPVTGKAGCYNGEADCRLSTSLYSHKWLYNKTTKVPMVGLGRAVGFLFNQTMVEKRWAKCAYIWDGASNNRFNRGCGDGALADCEKNGSAWNNICPSTKKPCTGDDVEIKRAKCKKYGGDHPVPNTHIGFPQCLYPAASINYSGQVTPEEWKGDDTLNKLRDMAKDRLELNHGQDSQGPNVEKWNEVVLDELLLLPDIWLDPAPAVPAFLYAKHLLPDSKKHAIKARDEFCKANKVDKIPLVMMNDMDPKDGKPFELGKESETSTEIVI